MCRVMEWYSTWPSRVYRRPPSGPFCTRTSRGLAFPAFWARFLQSGARVDPLLRLTAPGHGGLVPGFGAFGIGPFGWWVRHSWHSYPGWHVHGVGALADWAWSGGDWPSHGSCVWRARGLLKSVLLGAGVGRVAGTGQGTRNPWLGRGVAAVVLGAGATCYMAPSWQDGVVWAAHTRWVWGVACSRVGILGAAMASIPAACTTGMALVVAVRGIGMAVGLAVAARPLLYPVSSPQLSA
jgi:hypothetical protein